MAALGGGVGTSCRGRHSLGLREVGGWELIDVIREKFPLVSDASNVWAKATPAATAQFCHPCSMRFQLETRRFQVGGGVVLDASQASPRLIMSVLQSRASLGPW